jgi:glutathione S-transferase
MHEHCLYSFRRCPYAIRARMALAYAGIRVELREVKLNDKPLEFTRISSKATVPVLYTRTGELLEESLDIMYWALAISDPDQWLSGDDESADLIRIIDEEFKPILDAYKYSDRESGQSQLQHRNRAEPFLDILEGRLARQTWLMGEKMTISDVSIMPFIRQFSGVEPRWLEQSDFVRVSHWLERQIDSGLFRSAMQKYAFWQVGDPAVYFEPGVTSADE